MRRQAAQPNKRSFRLLVLPRRNSNIGVGLMQAAHSASVMLHLSAIVEASLEEQLYVFG
jgi:hypothetical protein